MTDIQITERAEQQTAGVRERVPMAELTEFFGRAFGQTMAALEAQGVHPAGPPFGKYYGSPTDVVDVEAGFPVTAAISPAGEVRPGTLPAGRVVEAVHVGPYDTMTSTYAEVEEFIAGAGLVAGPVMWESYLTGPEEHPDPATWQTQICWPVSDPAA
jgi:effector-binding domain-containing protein